MGDMKTNKIEPIHVSFVNPLFKHVRDLFWCSHYDGAISANANVFANSVFGPFSVSVFISISPMTLGGRR